MYGMDKMQNPRLNNKYSLIARHRPYPDLNALVSRVVFSGTCTLIGSAVLIIAVLIPVFRYVLASPHLGNVLLVTVLTASAVGLIILMVYHAIRWSFVPYYQWTHKILTAELANIDRDVTRENEVFIMWTGYTGEVVEIMNHLGWEADSRYYSDGILFVRKTSRV